jgi:hypothetical protein
VAINMLTSFIARSSKNLPKSGFLVWKIFHLATLDPVAAIHFCGKKRESLFLPFKEIFCPFNIQEGLLSGKEQDFWK